MPMNQYVLCLSFKRGLVKVLQSMQRYHTTMRPKPMVAIIWFSSMSICFLQFGIISLGIGSGSDILVTEVPHFHCTPPYPVDLIRRHGCLPDAYASLTDELLPVVLVELGAELAAGWKITVEGL